jgi:anti-anti-sigma factor
MKFSLLVLTPGSWQGKTVPINRSPFLIGRDPACQLRPLSTVVSMRHCALIMRDGRAFVKDLGSTNGTFVNDQRITPDLELHHGDWLRVGSLDFEVSLETTTPVNRPTPLPPTKGAAQPTDEELAALLLAPHTEPIADISKGLELELEEVPMGRTSTDLRVLKLVEWNDEGGAIAVHFTDRKILDEKKIHAIGDLLQQLVEGQGSRKYVLNLGNVRSLSSALVEQLLAFDKNIRRSGGKLALCNVHSLVFPVFEHARSAKSLVIRRTSQEALEALR